jgi:signal transduction histidine kinase
LEQRRAEEAFMKKSSILFLVLTASILLMSCGQYSGKSPPKAVNGFLDLTQWDFESDGTIKLDGQWEFYWNELLEPKDFDQKDSPAKTGFFNVPSSWNGYLVEGKKLTGHGYATFRLTVKIKKQQDLMALKIINMDSAYKLWMNEELILFNGIVGKSRAEMRSQILPKVARFKADSETIALVLQISNFEYYKGGTSQSLQFGTERQIQEIRDRGFALDLFLFGSLLIMGIYHLGLYLFRKKESSSLYFGAACLIIALRAILAGERSIVSLYPDFNYWDVGLKLEYLTFYLAIPAFATFIYTIYPQEFSKIILRIFQSVGVLFGLIVALTPVRVYSHTLVAYELITIIAGTYLIYVVILATVRRREGATFIAGGLLFLFLTVVNDILHTQNLIQTGFFAPFGLFVFILVQSFMLSLRFSRAFSEAEAMSEYLSKLNVENLKKYTAELEAANKELEAFSYSVSHDLRAPLRAIDGFSRILLKEHVPQLTPEAKRYLQLVSDNTQQMGHLIDDLLAFSRLSQQPLNKQTVMTADLVSQCLENLRAEQEGRRVEMAIGDLPSCQADLSLIKQVWTNLLSNALKYTRQREVAHIEIGCKDDGGQRIYYVRDNGVGFDMKYADKLFGVFQRLHRAEDYEGTGVGLAIVQRIVHRHGGRVWAEAEVDKGATFYFTI